MQKKRLVLHSSIILHCTFLLDYLILEWESKQLSTVLAAVSSPVWINCCKHSLKYKLDQFNYLRIDERDFLRLRLKCKSLEGDGNSQWTEIFFIHSLIRFALYCSMFPPWCFFFSLVHTRTREHVRKSTSTSTSTSTSLSWYKKESQSFARNIGISVTLGYAILLTTMFTTFANSLPSVVNPRVESSTLSRVSIDIPCPLCVRLSVRRSTPATLVSFWPDPSSPYPRHATSDHSTWSYLHSKAPPSQYLRTDELFQAAGLQCQQETHRLGQQPLQHRRHKRLVERAESQGHGATACICGRR